MFSKNIGTVGTVPVLEKIEFLAVFLLCGDLVINLY